jgi:hypothetical protein
MRPNVLCPEKFRLAVANKLRHYLRYIIGNLSIAISRRKFFLAVIETPFGSIICNNDTLFAFDVTYFLL